MTRASRDAARRCTCSVLTTRDNVPPFRGTWTTARTVWHSVAQSGRGRRRGCPSRVRQLTFKCGHPGRRSQSAVADRHGHGHGAVVGASSAVRGRRSTQTLFAVTRALALASARCGGYDAGSACSSRQVRHAAGPSRRAVVSRGAGWRRSDAGAGVSRAHDAPHAPQVSHASHVGVNAHTGGLRAPAGAGPSNGLSVLAHSAPRKMRCCKVCKSRAPTSSCVLLLRAVVAG